MIYVVSDIHGCYDEFCRLLEKIHFSDEDIMYILGDMVDRGPKPVRLLQDLMGRHNVYPILGNHEYMAFTILKKTNVVVTEENAESHLTAEDLTGYFHWTQDGGTVTVKQFSALSPWEKEDVLDYLEECSFYEDIKLNGKRYILVHGGLSGFSAERELDDYHIEELLFQSPDYSQRYFSDENTYLITGHTPTMMISGHGKSEIYRKNGHIAIDCGCVYGGRLAAICLDTGEEFYVEKI